MPPVLPSLQSRSCDKKMKNSSRPSGPVLFTAVLLAVSPALPVRAAESTLSVGVTAAGNCKFLTAGALLSFGSLDPSTPRDVNAVATMTFKCTKGASWEATDDGGLHDVPAGAYRMRHTALAAYLPYRLTYSNASGTSQGANVVETLTVDGRIHGADFVDARQGNYADTVTLTIQP